MVERMFREFEDRLPLKRILEVVNGARRDLQGTPAGALPELTERLARHRLDDLVSHTDEGGVLPDSAA